MTGLRRYAAAPVPILAGLVALGVWVQVYLIASHLFGAKDALDAHQGVGFTVHTIEVVVFLLALVAWTDKRLLVLSLALAVVGTVQLAFSGGDEWVGGLHGLFALAVLTLAVLIVQHARSGSGRREAIA